MEIPNYSDLWSPGNFPHLGQWLSRQPDVALFSGLAGSSDAWLIAELFSQKNAPVLVLVPNSKRAETLAAECAAFSGSDVVSVLPSRDAIPYNMKSPFGPTVEARLRVMGQLLDGEKRIYITPAVSLLQTLPKPRGLFNRIVRLRTGDDVSMETLSGWLTELGLRRETMVQDLGTFAIRGGIFDIYPFMTDSPIRLEFWGDTIESIRRFDVFTQRSRATLESAEIYPMREFNPSDVEIDQALARMRAWCDREGREVNGVVRLEHMWKSLADREGIEWFRHWFDPAESSLLDYLPARAVVVWDDILEPEKRLEEGRANYERHLERVPELFRPLVSMPDTLLIEDGRIQEELQCFTRVFAATASVPEGTAEYRVPMADQPAFAQQIDALIQDLDRRNAEGYEVILFCGNIGHAERLQELIGERCPYAKLVIGTLEKGFLDHENRKAMYSEVQIFRRQFRPSVRRKVKHATPISGFDALSPGDFVVHVDHGIGRFGGIERVRTGQQDRDCMVLQYDGRSKLFVPIEDFSKVQKYVGKESVAPPSLSKLGTGAWDRLKERTRRSLREMAEELIELYARREYMEGIRFGPDQPWQKEFEDSFIFDETPDQLTAIRDVKKDMQSKKPMDRLVCGDVGFGKTEVAMRAAFKAAIEGHQVALLAPTTILAAQHFATFTERMADFPISIAMLSRFLSAKEQREVVDRIARGKVDIVIGTHRLLSKDVIFKNLGLLIVDEEQRFGVKHKEKLKQYRYSVDVLSMTATPIPRTLHMSLVGARDLSIINTPPRNRLPVETRVSEYHDELLKNAIENELDRGGQVYVVHNRIGNMELLRDRIEQLVPRARVITAHGQMHEKDLEIIMREFIAGRYDVLLSTVIIENGLDIPNVNTIIVNRADTMGLSQLYQLRGRVGRSSEQAFAWLLTPASRQMDEDSLRRLRALEQYTELGSGFQIAMRDLEIRGAGNILGTRQHGFIAAVGFEMYCRLLKEAVDEIQGREPEDRRPETRVELPLEAFVPPEYIGDGSTRVAVYQDIASAGSLEELAGVERDMVDRFGPLPASADLLLLMMQIKVIARDLMIARVSMDASGALTLTIAGDREEAGEPVKNILAVSDREFEVKYEDSIVLRTALGATLPQQQAREIRALLLEIHTKHYNRENADASVAREQGKSPS